MIVVNFKAYSESQGEKAVDIAEKCLRAAEDTGEKVVVSPAIPDILRLEDSDIPVFSQHVDPVEPGSHTGSITAQDVKQAGATGTLLNHSENRMPKEEIRESIKYCREQGLTTIVCAQTPEECAELDELDPDYIAFEPPELIGGDVSVSSAKPEMIEKAVESSETPTLTGAGIKNRKDVEKSIELGCEGVLVASGVVKADNVYEEVKDLCQGL